METAPQSKDFLLENTFWGTSLDSPRLPSVSSMLCVSFLSKKSHHSFDHSYVSPSQICMEDGKEIIWKPVKGKENWMLLRSVFNQNCFTLLYTFAFLWGFRLRKHGFNFEYYLLLNDFPPNLKKKKGICNGFQIQRSFKKHKIFQSPGG